MKTRAKATAPPRPTSSIHAYLSFVVALGLAACGESSAALQTPTVDQPQTEPEAVKGYGPTEAATCDGALPLTMQAEDARLTGVEPRSDISGYEGSGFAGAFAQVGDQVTFSFCVPSTGYYTFDFRYANGSAETALRTLYLDGELLPGQHRFPSRWSWDAWTSPFSSERVNESALLNAGQHELTVSFDPINTGTIALDQVTVSEGPSPSGTSITSMLMNDWDQLVVGVLASRVIPSTDKDEPPRIGELRGRANWTRNNVDEAVGYVRDPTSGRAFTEVDRRPIETNIFVRDDGVLEMDYLRWGDNPLPVAVKKEHAAPPGSGVLVVTYTLTNVTDAERDFDLLEYVDLSRTGDQAADDVFDVTSPDPPSGQMTVEWRSDLQAFIADLSELHGTYVVMGAFESPSQLSTGPVGGGTVTPAEDGGGTRDVPELVSQFSDGDELVRVESHTGDDVEMGMVRTLTLPAGESGTASFFYAVRGSREAAEEAARTARSEPAESWVAQTQSEWSDWLGQRKTLALESEAHQNAYETALVSIKHAQQPEYGSFVAATNPAYMFKVWPRDAAVVAMGLDAAGYLEEAEDYWRWMADVQETGENDEFPVGTWWTNYSYWEKDRGIPFVQPEWDSLGLFTIGVYRHYLELIERDNMEEASAFFEEVWPAVQAASDFIANQVEPSGLGPADFGIWESFFEYKTFTQITYASGLQASYELGRVAGDNGETVGDEDLQSWLDAASSIRNAILAPYDREACTGLWLPDEGYFLRGIDDQDCSPSTTVDASTNLIWVFGLLDVEDEKAERHRQRVLADLSPTPYFHGISRFTDDNFYYQSIYSPGGPFESTVAEATWPQMSMYMAMAEQWLGFDALTRARLDWYVSVTCVEHMPPGEGIDWYQQQPLVSTAVEPVTGSWYLLALLNATGQFEPRLTRVGPSSDL